MITNKDRENAKSSAKRLADKYFPRPETKKPMTVDEVMIADGFVKGDDDVWYSRMTEEELIKSLEKAGYLKSTF